jgi:hypothetical protein
MSNSGFPVLISSENRRSANTYALSLPNTVDLNNFSVAVGNAYIYYSWYNVNSYPLNNNQFTLSIPGMTDQIITLPDGAYNIADLNNYLQYFFIQNGLFITNNTSGLNTYYASFTISPTSYAVQFTTNVIPASLPSGYTTGGTNMTNAFTNSNNLKHMQITISSTNDFKDIVGFNAGTYPSSSTGNPATFTKNSDYTPNVNPINAIQMRLSCAYNTFSSNTTLIHVFTNRDASVGEQIDASPQELQFVPCIGSHKEIILTFYDQAGRILNILDPNLVIKLIFKQII